MSALSMASIGHHELVVVPSTAGQRAQFLGVLPWGGSYSWKELQLLSEPMRMYRLCSGGTLFREGDPGDYLVVVVEGQLEVYKEDREGVPQVIALMGTGHCVGEMSLIDEWTRSATAIAKEDCALLVLSRDGFKQLSSAHPPVTLKFCIHMCRLISQRLRRASGALAERRNVV